MLFTSLFSEGCDLQSQLIPNVSFLLCITLKCNMDSVFIIVYFNGTIKGICIYNSLIISYDNFLVKKIINFMLNENLIEF